MDSTPSSMQDTAKIDESSPNATSVANIRSPLEDRTAPDRWDNLERGGFHNVPLGMISKVLRWVKAKWLSRLGAIYGAGFMMKGRIRDINKAIEYTNEAVSLTPDGHAARPERLNNLGTLYGSRYVRLGNLEDIDKAIGYSTEAVSITPDGYPDRYGRLNDLGVWHQKRFRHLGELADINKSIHYIGESGLLTPEGHTGRPAYLNNIAGSYIARFERSGQVEDIEKAITYLSEAVLITLGGQAEKPEVMTSLGVAHHSRFNSLGELEDINKAIECSSEAVSLTPDGHTRKPERLGNLGASYGNRFKRLGNLADLDEAIQCDGLAVLLTPEGHADMPARLNNLGSSYHSRFQRRGEVVDIEKAINCISLAVSLTPDEHAEKPRNLNNLGTIYQSRFERLGELADINMAIECSRQALLLTPDEHPRKPVILNSLGGSELELFSRLGRLSDIDGAINHFNEAALLTPTEHIAKPGLLNNLGCSHYSRFARLDDLADINKAIEYSSEALSLTPEEHAYRHVCLSSLGSWYQHRFKRQGEPADLDKAIQYQSQAVMLAPEGDASKSKWLNNLGNSFQSRFDRRHEVSDVDEAIECKRRAVSLTPDGHADKPKRLSNLGSSYQSRFELSGELAYIEQAIYCGSEAVSLTPDGHSEKPAWLRILGISHESRFKRLGEQTDIEISIDCFKRAAQCSTGYPHDTFSAARKWAQLCFFDPTASPLDAYKQVMALVPELVWLGITIGRRYEHITRDIDNVALEAAAAAISMQNYQLALEWLEEGRSIVWKQLLQLRTPLQDLFAADPGLAEQLQQVSKELEHTSSLKSVEVPGLPDRHSLEQAAQQHRRLAEKWEQLVNRARLLPHLNDFLRPRKASELTDCAQAGAVVIVNVHKTRCDALLLLPGNSDITHIPLINFSQKAVDARARLADSLQSQGLINRGVKVGRPKPEDTFGEILLMLWKDIVKPVLDHLGYTETSLSIDDLPHITWCTTGPLSFLPLHAAGDYSNLRPRLYEFAVSSYTPTLSALLASPPHPTMFSGILVVGQSSTPGFNPLPETTNELARIEEQTAGLRLTRLENDKATIDTVLKALEEHSWVHFACHATQEPAEPTKSAFHLNDGALDLAAITQKSLKTADFAFLSACQTATGDKELSDEAVHLAAGMIMAGYPTVIATMWSIQDKDGPIVAEKVYASLLEGGVPNARRAAKALHIAVAGLRDKVGVKSFAKWAPFIHIGL